MRLVGAFYQMTLAAFEALKAMIEVGWDLLKGFVTRYARVLYLIVWFFICLSSYLSEGDLSDNALIFVLACFWMATDHKRSKAEKRVKELESVFPYLKNYHKIKR